MKMFKQYYYFKIYSNYYEKTIKKNNETNKQPEIQHKNKTK